jgi:hypothetical protein
MRFPDRSFLCTLPDLQKNVIWVLLFTSTNLWATMAGSLLVFYVLELSACVGAVCLIHLGRLRWRVKLAVLAALVFTAMFVLTYLLPYAWLWLLFLVGYLAMVAGAMWALSKLARVFDRIADRTQNQTYRRLSRELWMIILGVPIALLIDSLAVLLFYRMQKWEMVFVRLVISFASGLVQYAQLRVAQIRVPYHPYSLVDQPGTQSVQLLSETAVGAGQFGSVFVGTWQDRQVALKQVASTEQSYYFREALNLMKLRNQHVVEFFGLYRHPSFGLFLVMELMRDDLRSWLLHSQASQPGLPNDMLLAKLHMMLSVSMGLKYLASQGIVHR